MTVRQQRMIRNGQQRVRSLLMGLRSDVADCREELGISFHILAKLNSRAGNRTPATAGKTPGPNH